LLPTFNPIVVTAVAGAGAVSAAIDMRAQRVPNPLTLGIAVVGVALAAVHATPVGITGALAGMGVGLALMLPGHIIGATGAGDVKLFAAMGAFIGPRHIFTAFLYTALAGGVIAIVISLWRRRLRQTLGETARLISTAAANAPAIESPLANNRFAYAPAIAVGTMLAALGL